MIEMKTWNGAIILGTELDLFKIKQFELEIILLSTRWYLKYSLSYRNLVGMMEDVKRIRPFLKPTNTIPTERMKPILKSKDNGNIFTVQWIQKEMR